MGGVASALMIIIGYPGELLLAGAGIAERWYYWAGAMIPFCYIVKELIFGLEEAGQRDGRWRQGAHLEGPVVDRGQLVDLPGCLHHPSCGFPRTAGTGGAGCVVHP